CVVPGPSGMAPPVAAHMVSAHMVSAHMVSAPLASAPLIGTVATSHVEFAVSGPPPSAGGALLHAKRQRHVVGGNGRHQLQNVVVLGILLDAPMIHLLQGLMILLAEGHWALWRFEGEPLHGSDQLFGGTGAGLLQTCHYGRGGCKTSRHEEVGRSTEALLVLGLEPVVHRVGGKVVVVIDSTLGAGELLPRIHDGKDVAAGC